MFSKLLDLIKQALQKMLSIVDKNNVTDASLCVSDKMKNALELWEKMYRDESPWLSDSNGIYSLGVAPEICSELARSVMLEMSSKIVEDGQSLEYATDDDNITDTEGEDKPDTRAGFLDSVYQKGVINVLREKLEHGMATGGMIIKPYHSNGHIYFDFNSQGEFVPLAFSDDGIITDIAFVDSFVYNNKKYTKVERHIFDSQERMVTVVNKAFVSENLDDFSELGREVQLSKIDRWAGISEEPAILNDMDGPLYGFYKVPQANNVDVKSPLGVSVFNRAIKMIKRADHQLSRLEWEYHAGQMAVDVDPTSIKQLENLEWRLPETEKRVFRSIDTGEIKGAYHEFAPVLRDANYIDGLNTYLMRIEDLCALSRGTLSNPMVEARTATEVLVLKQRAYDNIHDNQKALETALKDVIHAMNKYADWYNLAPKGNIDVTFNWGDSVLTDTETQLEQKLTLQSADILSKAEVRAWYTGESLKKAQEMIDEIKGSKPMLKDIYTVQADEDTEDNEDVVDEE